MKSISIKLVLMSTIMAIFFSTTVSQGVASASTNQDLTIKSDNNELVVTDGPKGVVQPAALPPRQSPNDPFWKYFNTILAGFVGIQLAQTITQNAINNGIDYACKKYKNTWGVPTACKIVQN